MKHIREKFKRTMHYWSVSYKQASGRERLSMGLFAAAMFAYAWWVMQVL